MTDRLLPELQPLVLLLLTFKTKSPEI